MSENKILGLVSRERVVKTIKGGILSMSLTTSLSLILFIYQRALEPIYGSVPTNLYLWYVVVGAGSLGVVAPTFNLWTAIGLAGALLSVMPYSTYWAGVYSARFHDPVYGPLATHLAVLAPIIYLGANIRITMETETPGSPVIAAPLPAFFSFTGFFGLVKNSAYFSWLTFLNSIPNEFILYALSVIGVILWGISDRISQASAPDENEKTSKPGKDGKTKSSDKNTKPKDKAKQKRQSTGGLSFQQMYLLPLILALPYLQSYIRPPTLLRPLMEAHSHSSYPLRILSSTQSTTGVIVVGESLSVPAALFGEVPENHIENIRYLRAGHSLLGGVWINDKVAYKEGIQRSDVPVDAHGQVLGDSIYAAFMLQEVARLAGGQDAPPDKQKALIIGLGIGVAASSFMRHGINTTIVEIDPAVYDAARYYFGLPKPDQIYLQDAKRWVKRQSSLPEEERKLYDIVVHDCFSGGGVPAQIFTVEFWEGLKKLMKPNGVVAVNFAGKLTGKPSRAILTTLEQSFGGCRGFHDSISEVSDEQMKADFLNIVFFCSPSSEPLAFREPVEEDYLHSYLREHVFTTPREINLALITEDMSEEDKLDYVLTDKKNKLGKWQEEGGLEHWKVMRDVLPDIFWETY
ncbi:S-adenosyl-L-methionine-dependent methyltransferase [Heliocybe sulcata]|uniref:S-adenosyl-L-methionine-dependent methyltransferase n=1 Tax=Heliocybe sulcata TaxID=5364 RepID=A0A5C3NDZ8_9AGAM|nr:S-adenosyl-L-methionine-dependent methyltransferase [Heliocybe sulcata]